MKVWTYLIAAAAGALVASCFLRPETVYVENVDQVATLQALVARNSLQRTFLEERVLEKQRQVDSLTALAQRVRTLPARQVDAIAQLRPVRRDSLTCVDERTYRELVIAKLAFGEEKYSLCLGQRAAQDSMLLTYKEDLGRALHTVKALNTERHMLSLKLESEQRRQRQGMIVGFVTGMGAALAVTYFATRN